MKIMNATRTILITLSLSCFFILASCNNDDDNNNGITLQAHDSSDMMDRMHAMMTEMMAMQPTNDPDNDFAMMMKMHHQGAINMANLELADGDNAEMKQLAQMMIEDQQMEIQQMTNFLQSHAPHLSMPEFHMMQMENMDRSGRNSDLQILTGDTDHDFAILMIQHHQSAIENSLLELIHGEEPEMRDMAMMMIEAQQQEITTMQNWLLANN